MNSRERAPRTVRTGRSTRSKTPDHCRPAVPVWFLVTLAIVLSSTWIVVTTSTAIVRAELALGRGDLRTARRLAAQELRTHPGSDRALTVAGMASLAMQDVSSAQAYLSRVSTHDPLLFSVSQRELGRIAMNSGRVVLAEESLRKSLEVAPGDAATLDQLIYLLMLEGRGWEARALVLDRIRSGVVTTNYLMIAGQPDRGLEMASQFSENCLSAVPDEPLPRLVLAQQDWRDNQVQSARDQLEQVLAKHPDLLEAHALLGQVVVESGALHEFEQACERLPPTARNHPVIWLSRGIASERRGQTEASARCYWEALRLNPDLVRANYGLSQALAALQRPEQARPFAERAKQLTKLSLEMSSLTNELNLTTLPAIVEQLETLGRHWEAAGWCDAILKTTGSQPEWARAAQSRLSRSLAGNPAWNVPSLDPSRIIDLSHYRLPAPQGDLQPTNESSTATSSGGIAFQDDAAATGLRFTYQNGAEPGDLESLLEMNGGGVAALDYDGDGWPDVFFTQGGSLPPAPFDAVRCDQLFRNSGGAAASSIHERFVNVTVAAGLRDVGYGQGVTTGDFDNDGFPDLYVGNVGGNQLYHNNGDGTFSDVTAAAGTAAGGWTSSCVLADLNQDGLPDLYAVTYLGGEAIYQACNKRVHPRCSPLRYAAEPDRFYLNSGDGSFRDLSETHGLEAAEGRGLGVVAADFDGSLRLSLFVANDMTANFFFLNQTMSPESIQFAESALLSGLALDHLGQPKACMGIAAGDCNQDGRLDLFVTNFYRQSNDLYAQEADGSFREISREAMLFDASFLKLGWGTQFLDADLDGRLDLIVTNGHVHDPLDARIPYRMPAQLFRNLGGGRFAEVPDRQLGEFFERQLSGRSLARLDWNRDGREDVCISHLNEPAALLTNGTKAPGNFLSLRLIAVNSARDAIGASVQVVADDLIAIRQLTAGDGFHASNERRLTFGLGPRQVAETVVVRWPSGVRQDFHQLEGNREWLLIEQRSPQETSIPSQRDRNSAVGR